MQENIEQICKGHLVHKTKRCYGCINDDWNKQCPNYEPFYVIMFHVAEACLDDEVCSDFDEGGMYK